MIDKSLFGYVPILPNHLRAPICSCPLSKSAEMCCRLEGLC